MADDRYRPDGTKKGPGFLGTIKNPDGTVSTELSIGVDFGKGETLIPALVPSLTKEEIDYLAGGGKMTDAIVGKAVKHAKSRIAGGLSPFYSETERTKEDKSMANLMQFKQPEIPIYEQIAPSGEGEVRVPINRPPAGMIPGVPVAPLRPVAEQQEQAYEQSFRAINEMLGAQAPRSILDPATQGTVLGAAENRTIGQQGRPPSMKLSDFLAGKAGNGFKAMAERPEPQEFVAHGIQAGTRVDPMTGQFSKPALSLRPGVDVPTMAQQRQDAAIAAEQPQDERTTEEVEAQKLANEAQRLRNEELTQKLRDPNVTEYEKWSAELELTTLDDDPEIDAQLKRKARLKKFGLDPDLDIPGAPKVSATEASAEFKSHEEANAAAKKEGKTEYIFDGEPFKVQ